MSALRCDVLFPGAAVASMMTQSGEAGGESTIAGKHDALSCKMRRPSEYSGVSVSCVCGGNNRRFSTCTSRANFLRGVMRTSVSEDKIQKMKVHFVVRVANSITTHLEGLNGIVDGPFQGVNPHITRNMS